MDDFVFITSLREWLFLLVRWSHIISAVVWVGGSAVMALVIYPSRNSNQAPNDFFAMISIRYRQVIHLVIITLILSGITLVLERIYISSVPPIWFILLGVKVAIGAWMFYIIWHKRNIKQSDINQNPILKKLSFLLGYNALLAFGVLAIFLASLMQRVFELANGF